MSIPLLHALMNERRRPTGRAYRLLLLLLVVPGVLVAQPSAQYAPPEGVHFRAASVMSDGTRIHAEIFAPADAAAGQRLPTIIQAHGWGGLAAQLRADAVDLARAGYQVINFDYRGWGESDARIVLSAPSAPSAEGLTFTAEVRKIEGVVDPLDQTDDWFSVIHWAMAEPSVDPARVGVRGSSLSGGHVLYVAAHEPRVRAIVSQVPATNPAEGMQRIFSDPRDIATRRARGELEWPQPRVREFNLTGTAIQDKFLRYNPVEAAHRIGAPTLIIVAEREELYNNESQGKLAYDRIVAPKSYLVIPEITHYGIYSTARPVAIARAIDWFDRFLVP